MCWRRRGVTSTLMRRPLWCAALTLRDLMPLGTQTGVFAICFMSVSSALY